MHVELGQYDLFLIYEHSDAQFVEGLASTLTDRGLHVWFDKWELVPGQAWASQLEEAISQSKTIGVCIGPGKVIRRIKGEIKTALSVKQEARSHFIIPILLPGSSPSEIPPYLAGINFADLRQGNDSKTIEWLVAAIKKRGITDGEVSLTDRLFALPRPPSFGFVQRQDATGRDIVARLKEELAPEKNQLVALWGAGGVGKTTLAAQTAREMAELAPNRIVWIGANSRASFALSILLDEIAVQLGESEIRKLVLEAKKEAVRALIFRSDAPTLVVLDDFETVSPEEQEHCVEWFTNDPCCPALITTRSRVVGARNVAIDVMSTSEANEFLDRVIPQTQNVRVFEELDRSRIVEAAEANPLVMQWVIAQIDLAQRPGNVLDDLARGEGDAAQRVSDRWFNLPQLGNDGRDALLALSLFVPDAPRNALVEVAGFGDDERRLSEAVKSLAALCLVETASAGGRLAIRGLTRDLARDRLIKDERSSEFRRRFVAHFVGYAELHSETTKEDFDALEPEKDNILGSVDVAFETADWRSVMRIAYAIGLPTTGFLGLRGYWGEGMRCNKQALEAARVLRSKSDIAAFTHNLAVMHADRGDLNAARGLYNESLEIAKKLDNQSGIAITLHQLAMLVRDQGEIDEARRLYGESLEINKKLGDQSGIAGTLHQLATLANDRGEIDNARRLYNESLEINEKLGNWSGIASTLHQLGRLAQDQGERVEARRLYNESLAIKQKLGNQSGIAITLHQLGRLIEDEGDYAEASWLFREALSILQKLKSPNAQLARRSLERAQSKMK
ncbi:MAG TPA: tetratricopeptide repeat protein [Blastocatellia bacterium]|nr:tetratricopeptide repeat protein [Blastocatellia bacterium]